MIIEEKVVKDQGGVSRRANELGLRMRDVTFLDWNPLFVTMFFDLESVGKAPGFKGPLPPDIFDKLAEINAQAEKK